MDFRLIVRSFATALFFGLCYAEAFMCSPATVRGPPNRSSLSNGGSEQGRLLEARVLGISTADSDFVRILDALRGRGFQHIAVPSDENDESNMETSFVYKYQKATGLLKLVSLPGDVDPEEFPRWIPLVNSQESVLIQNGWSFLDPDESEPMSAFDVDAANLEGTYKPKWGEEQEDSSDNNTQLQISSLGFNVAAMSSSAVMQLASALPNDRSRLTLLEGDTDPSGQKTTSNSVNFSGAAGQSDIPMGLFACAIGGLPLFSTLDLAPTTAASGWLSFTRPIIEDHIIFVHPKHESSDQRIEVLCARSRCHLGHFFGSDGSFCINASGLHFVKTRSYEEDPTQLAAPLSWRCLDSIDIPSQKQLKDFLVEVIPTNKIVLGAGCFWHVEASLRRLIGVVDTKAGFAGGTLPNPSYEDVCHRNTGHTEVVLVEYDPSVLSTKVLVDAFFALHNPTTVRSHGKHAAGTGQYRSVILAMDDDTVSIAREVMLDCKSQLQKEIVTEIEVPGTALASWFFPAEERHQRHEQKRESAQINIGTLAGSEWLQTYGKRSDSIQGTPI
jgi:methionine-S-sulfoxide reductase